jgi:hypothetical protein
VGGTATEFKKTQSGTALSGTTTGTTQSGSSANFTLTPGGASFTVDGSGHCIIPVEAPVETALEPVCRPGVTLKTAQGTPMLNVPVGWAVGLGGGVIAPEVPGTRTCSTFAATAGTTTSSVPGSLGKAGVCWTMGSTTGTNTVVATPTAGGDAPLGVTFSPANKTFTATATLFNDGFESASPWTATGLWNRSTLLDLTSAPIVNSAAPAYVDLIAPEAYSKLPSPKTGAYAFWYGGPANGNYLGTQQAGDAAHSGGTSTAANSGVLTSPAFAMPSNPAVSLTLRLDTWWEIESVNPSGFDLMTLSVQDVSGGGTITDLGVLNPASDPAAGPASRPLTSGGLNVAPVWVNITQALDAYRGKTIRLLFTFNTRDPLFNGFRGWLIDNVQVTSEVAVPSFSRMGSAQLSTNGASLGGAPSHTLNPKPAPRTRP